MIAAAEQARPMPGIVYLLHFDRPYAPYPGAPRRDVAQHGTGRGARLMAVVLEAGITWQLARTWPGGGDRERPVETPGRGGAPLPAMRRGAAARGVAAQCGGRRGAIAGE